MSKQLAPLQKYYVETVAPALVTSRGYKNRHQVPKLLKIVINSGIGAEHFVPCRPREQSGVAHGGAADAHEVDLHARTFRLSARAGWSRRRATGVRCGQRADARCDKNVTLVG